MRRNFSLAASALAMIVLILDSKNALQAAFDGVQLCIQTLIPSLFPFLVISALLTSPISCYSGQFFSPLERLMHIPRGTGSIFLIGLLAGYPVGAKCLRQAYDSGTLDQRTACRMLSFCSNAGPSFLFGVVALFFPHWKYPWLLWGMHILSAIFVGMVTTENPGSNVISKLGKTITLTQALNQAIRTMATICGWVVFFRLLISFPERWFFWMLPDPIRILITGFLELSNGCMLLGNITSLNHRMMAASAMLSFGGLCVAMQTKSLWGDLPFESYIKGKFIQTVCSLLLCADYLYLTGNIKTGLEGIFLLIGHLLSAVFLTFRFSRKKKLVAIPV